MVPYPSHKMATRRAEWIWRQRPVPPAGIAGVFAHLRPFEQEKNRFVYFRRAFELGDAPQGALMHISADGRYQLFVNGVFIGRGPARCDPAFQYYDSYEIAPHLRAGQNVVAILAHSYGQDMSWYELPRHEASRILGCGGIFVQTDIRLRRDEVIHLDSDDSWRYLESAAWQQDSPEGAVGFVEIYDARLAPQGWQAADFDDHEWPQAQLLKGSYWPHTPPVRPFPVMVPCDIPPLLEEPRRPTRIHRVGEVREAPDMPTLPQQIGAEALEPLQGCRASAIEALLEGSVIESVATVQTTPDKAVALVFDFGATVTGRPSFTISAPAGAIIDIGTSERLQNDHIEPRMRSFLTSENIDRVITRAGRQQWERFEWTGFRYLQLTIRNAAAPSGALPDTTEPVTLHDLHLNFTAYPVQERGAFSCSDEMLTRIWQAGAETVRLCMHDGFEDCPQREQRQFLGDAYIEALTNFVAFGDPYLTAKFLRQVTQSQRADGMTQVATPSNAAAENLITITDFCLYWLMTLREYVRYVGDAAILVDLYPAIERALAWFERFIDSDNLLNNLPHWLFVDWAEVDKRGQSTVINAQYVHTLRMCAELADRLELPARGHAWRAQADRTETAINQHLWDEERGVYVDCRVTDGQVEGVQSRHVTQHASGICLAYDLVPKERIARAIAYITDPERVKLTPTGTMLDKVDVPPFDEEKDVTLTQPFFAHHLHRGLIRNGHLPWVLENIRTRWGAMIEAGSTTIWEQWNPVMSQCHGWSTTPTYELTTYLLGVTPLTDGFESIAVAPQLAGLTWAKGTVPTPRGEVHLSWAWNNPHLNLTIELPENVSWQLTLPLVATQITLNGQLLWAAGKRSDDRDRGITIIEQPNGHLLLSFTRGGKFALQAQEAL